MKIASVILVIFFFSLMAGCGNHMTRAETIAAVKECEDAGMGVVIYKGIGWDGSVGVARIDCEIKEEKRN